MAHYDAVTGTRAAARIGRWLGQVFAADDNPWHQLGALGFYLFWIVSATGIYVYAVFDTSVDGAYASIEHLSREQWYFGGVMRSLHRYASDAFVVVLGLHLLRELLCGHWRGFRWFSWVSGVPLIWLVYASGIGGYWLVWDQLARFSIIATAEWLDWLPLGADAIVRSFLYQIDDRFFSLLISLHIGIPLLLLAMMWVHIQRISHVKTLPTRRLGFGVFGMLLAVSLARPAMSHAPASVSMLQPELALDWFYLFIHPLQYSTSPGTLWSIAGAVTLLLAVLPLVSREARATVAVVSPQFCNGCARCAADCPYAAITMEPRAGGRAGQRLPRVLADQCASCGICAGACPSSTPFRSIDDLITGIDMPQRPIVALREALEGAIKRQVADRPLVLFGCERGAALSAVDASALVVIPLLCAAMLPPSFIEYALRAGAGGVLVNGCAPGECEYRLGMAWARQRLAGEREPHLRTSVPAERFRFVSAGRGEEATLRAAVAEFRAALSAVKVGTSTPSTRRLKAHG